MAIKGLEWVGDRRMAHVVVGLMIFVLSMTLLMYLNIIEFATQLSMLIVTLAGFAWEYFNKNQHEFGLPKNIFDNYGVISTMMGGAIGVTGWGIISLLRLFIGLF